MPLTPAARRRRLVLATPVVLAVIGGLVAAVLLLTSGGGSGDGPLGAALRGTGVDQSSPGPVLLVPGYGGNASALGPLADRLRAGGRDVTVVQLPGDGTGDLTEQAATLGASVDAALARTGAGSVDVVGYSAGGVVTRLWVADDGGAEVARRVVTLGSPHHGTQVAALAADLVAGLCPAACRQLVPGSPLLADLNSGDETPDGPQWLALWTTDDQVVTPVTSGSLDGAVDIELQQACPGRTVSHSDLPRDPAVMALVVGALGVDPPQDPSACPV